MENPVLANYHKLMASQRSFLINVVGNNSQYHDKVHTFTMELLRYCEPQSMPWDQSEDLGVSWGTLKRSFVSSSPRPCRLNFVVDSLARPHLEQWLGRVFETSAIYTNDRTPPHEQLATEVPGLEQCKAQRRVRPAQLLPGLILVSCSAVKRSVCTMERPGM